MTKQIKDYTLGEAKDVCDKYIDCGCNGCPLKVWCDKGDYAPGDWDLSEAPRWTPEEAELAKAIRVMWPEASYIEKCKCIVLVRDRPVSGTVVGLSTAKFPSLKAGEIVTLEEIINEK